MPVIVLLQHGETGSPEGYLTTTSCLGTMKITVAIPSSLRKPMQRRPKIICAPDNAPQRTATLVASMLHSETETCDALGEAVNEVALRTFAFRCLKSGNDVIIVSHEATIKAFIAILAAVSDRPYADRRNGALKPGQFIVIDTDGLDISLAAAPAKLFP